MFSDTLPTLRIVWKSNLKQKKWGEENKGKQGEDEKKGKPVRRRKGDDEGIIKERSRIRKKIRED